MKRKVGVWLMILLQAKDPQRLLATRQKPGERPGPDPLRWPPEGTNPAYTSIWGSSLQN